LRSESIYKINRISREGGVRGRTSNIQHRTSKIEGGVGGSLVSEGSEREKNHKIATDFIDETFYKKTI